MLTIIGRKKKDKCQKDNKGVAREGGGVRGALDLRFVSLF